MARRNSTRAKLHAMLNRDGEISLTYASQQLGIGKKQVGIQVKNLQNEGVPVRLKWKDRQRVFYLEPENQEHKVEIWLSEEQILALAVAAMAAGAELGPTPMGEPLHEAVDIVIEPLKGQVYVDELEEFTRHWNFSSSSSATINPHVFRTLLQAVRECHSIDIQYFSASSNRRTRRKVDPYGIAVRKGSWILVAYCHDRDGVRDFNLTGISEDIRETEEYFVGIQFDLEEHFRKRMNVLAGGKEQHILLKVEPDRVPYFQRKRYHHSQKLTMQQDDSALVEFTVSGLEEIRSFVQSWGVGVTVLEPPELVEIIRDQALQLAERYGSAPKPPH